MRDKHGKLAVELIPQELPSGYAIESRLRLSGVTALQRMDQTVVDDRSVAVQYGYASNTDENIVENNLSEEWIERDNDQISELGDDFSLVDDPIDQLGYSTTNAGIWGFIPGEDSNELVLLQQECDEEYQQQQREQQEEEIEGKLLEQYELVDHHHDEYSEISQLSQLHSITTPSIAFTHDTDNLHAEGLHNLTDAHSIKTALTLNKENNIIRELFRNAESRIHVWYSAAMKETELLRIVTCPLNCNIQCKIETLTYHVQNECINRLIQCKLCNRMIRFIDLKVHNIKLCPKRMVACPNAYHGCREIITQDSIDIHLLSKCNIRKIYCRQLCGVCIQYNKREKHELGHCKNRIIQCDQCKENIIANTYTEHLHHHCIERLIMCSVSCKQYFKAKDIKIHETTVCIQPCKYNCGAVIGPPEQLILHETSVCANKPMKCMYHCNTTGLSLKDIHQHESLYCKKRPLLCTNGCGKCLPVEKQSAHTEVYCGDCRERPVRCPSNLIGWRVRLLGDLGIGEGEAGAMEGAVEGIVLQYRRRVEVVDTTTGRVIEGGNQDLLNNHPHNTTLTTTSNGDNNSNNNDSKIVKIKERMKDELFIRTKHSQQWHDYWNSRYILLHKVQGENLSKKQHINKKFPCGWIVYANIDEHLHFHCPNREVYVNSSSSSSRSSRSSRTHINSSKSNEQNNTTTSSCNSSSVLYRGQKTKFSNVVETAEKRVKIDHFNTINTTDNIGNEKERTTTYCGYCSMEIDKLLLEKHIQNDCAEYILKCPYICNMEIRRKHLQQHIESECSKRLVLCGQCGSKDLWAEELVNHETHYCSRRKLPCPLECDEKEVGGVILLVVC